MAGSIEKRGKDSYRLSCIAGYDLQGKPIKKTKTIHGTIKDAKIELAKFVADVQKGLYVEGKSLKFEDFVEIWKRDYGEKELAPSTYTRFLGMLNSRIIPYFSHFHVDKIKPTDIMQFYDLLSKDTQIVRRKNNNSIFQIILLLPLNSLFCINHLCAVPFFMIILICSFFYTHRLKSHRFIALKCIFIICEYSQVNFCCS